MDLPNFDNADILCTDRLRPRLVIVDVPSRVRPVVDAQSHHAPIHHERPHGGEPNLRLVVSSGTSTSSDSGSTSSTWVHVPWLDSASDDVKLVVGTPVVVPATEYIPRSTEGMTHKQHKDGNVNLPGRLRW